MSKKRAAWAFVVAVIIAGGGGWWIREQGEASARTVAAGTAFRLDVSPSAQEPASMKAFELLLTLADPEGKPVEGAVGTATLAMPNMFCGILPAEITELSNGEYRLTGVPVMKGKWQAAIRFAAGEEIVQAKHDFRVS